MRASQPRPRADHLACHPGSAPARVARATRAAGGRSLGEKGAETRRRGRIIDIADRPLRPGAGALNLALHALRAYFRIGTGAYPCAVPRPSVSRSHPPRYAHLGAHPNGRCAPMPQLHARPACLCSTPRIPIHACADGAAHPAARAGVVSKRGPGRRLNGVHLPVLGSSCYAVAKNTHTPFAVQMQPQLAL
ncbi:hypothetical protein HYPSUDRAFT_202990 [Hypholoma sublateritium FD-334 SS-4]|uniref:Uncharacterized protein n=1 Tax=Hypholoma sublateritium (strain FD-334 SS-4) TaxID=945553 RepID=A0A0D2L3R3_HYPSF|nr:hypothetical protein HYPSUDRAFT_202990 [Hypholoma sublateritium FD-334 SS-4]